MLVKISEYHIFINHAFKLTNEKKNLKIQIDFIPLVQIMNIAIFL